jgi:hypothetical protein
MCYEERLFRLWATKKQAQEREKNEPASEQKRTEVKPIRPVLTPDSTRRKEVEREFEEIV